MKTEKTGRQVLINCRRPLRWLIAAVLFFAHPLMAQFDYGFDFSKAGTAGFQFVKIGVGARQIAMGDASAGIVGEATAVFWNPAGLGWLEKRQVVAHHSNWLVNSKHSAVAVAFPTKWIHVGISAISLTTEDFEETTVSQPLGTGRMVNAGDILFGLTLTRRFTDRLSIGGQVKFVQENLDEQSFSNLLFDVGTVYYTGFRDLRISFTLQHFGPDMIYLDQKFKMPLLFRVGVADDLVKTEKMAVLAVVDLVHPTDNNEWVNWGLEAQFLNALALRGGYRLNVDEAAWTAGVGLTVPGLSGLQPQIDYGFSSYGDVFGQIHRFTIALGF